MPQGIQAWSLTPASNATSDANINWAEGQLPPTVNNSARGMMTALRAFYNALGGGIVYGGAASAYTATNDTAGTWTAYAEGQIIGLEANHTNGAAATINVDALGAKSILKASGAALVAGDMVSGDFYLLRYNGTSFSVIGPSNNLQPLDATLTALAALAWSSGSQLPTFTAADVVSFTSIGTSGAVLGLLNGSNTHSGTNVFNTGTNTFATGSLRIVDANNTFTNDASDMRWNVDVGDNLEFNRGNNRFRMNAGGSVLLEVTPSVLTYLAVAIRVAGKTSIPVPASSMVGRNTAGAAIGTTEGATNRVMLRTLDYDQATQEFGQFTIPAMPKSWNESTITMRFIWTSTVTGDVVWGVQAVALSDDDPFDGAFGTAINVTDSVTLANDVMKSAETAAVTIGGTPVDGDMVVFQVFRDAANGADTAAGDAKLIGVELFITSNLANDA